jgi:SAM-dependent methyltransferase
MAAGAAGGSRLIGLPATASHTRARAWSAFLDSAARVRVCGKSPVGAFLRANEWTWSHLPDSALETRPVRACGHWLHALVRRWATRRHYRGTFFLRNRPQLELIRRLIAHRQSASAPTMAVLGCSNGAEVYSILAAIRLRQPALKMTLHAVDISHAVLQIAQAGAYSGTSAALVGAPIFERLTGVEVEQMFDRDGDQLIVKSPLRTGVVWHLGDASDPRMRDVLGLQDLVVANNFLCHMAPPVAERCLRQIAQLVKPGGYLIVSGIDLDVRTKVARELGWKPVTTLLEDIHEGDVAVRRDWPWAYWGLEPLDKSRPDWTTRYAAVFQIEEPEIAATSPAQRKSASL